MKRLVALLVLAAAAGLAAPALAADEEIQVYMDDLDRPGQFGLDLHNNYVMSGDPGVDYAGEMSSLHRYRLTPEWSYGLTRNIELGLYLPLTTLDGQGHYAADGVKGRIKFVAPQAQGQTWFWGLNLEIGRVSHGLDENPWNGELKGILGDRFGRWTVASNLNLDFKLAGPAPAPASLDFDTKVSYALTKTFAVGVESYNGLGTFHRFGSFASSDQAIYGAVDASLGKWDLNFGLGHGYGSSADGWVMKAIISVPIDG
ncbi:MAG TPA: hypothetical protein VIB82_00090 [Caulobacteraceae bacterium]